jgi:hypothetical protein
MTRRSTTAFTYFRLDQLINQLAPLETVLCKLKQKADDDDGREVFFCYIQTNEIANSTVEKYYFSICSVNGAKNGQKPEENKAPETHLNFTVATCKNGSCCNVQSSNGAQNLGRSWPGRR